MRVHVCGMVTLNGGDAAIAEGQFVALRDRWPDVRFSLSDFQRDAAAKYLPDLTFEWTLWEACRRAGDGSVRRRKVFGLARRRMRAAAAMLTRGVPAALLPLLPHERRALAPLWGSDVVAYTGGTTLTENYRLEPKVFDLEIAKVLGKPVALFQQSAGPFTTEGSRRTVGPVLAAADLVLLRDERSLRHVLDVGARPETCHVLPDIAFALVREASPRPGGERPRVAVSLRDWKYFADKDPETGMREYLGAVDRAVSAVVRHGCDVVFVSTCQGRPEYAYDDSAVALRLVEQLAPDVRAHVVVDREPRRPTDLRDFLGTCDLMLSTRLHGAILGLAAGIPVLAIAYEHKTTEVWQQMGLTEWLADIDAIDGDELTKKLLELVDRVDEVRAHVAREVPAQREGALRAADLIGALVSADGR